MSVQIPVGQDPIDERVAGVSSERAAEELGHVRVGVQLGERTAVRVAPPTEHQPIRPDLGDRWAGHGRDQLGAARSRRGKTASAKAIAAAPTAANNASPATLTVPVRTSRDAR